MKKRTVTVTFRFDPELERRLGAAAKRAGLTRSEYARRALAERLEREKREEGMTAYDRLKPWIGCVRSDGTHDSRDLGRQYAEAMEEKFRARRAR